MDEQALNAGSTSEPRGTMTNLFRFAGCRYWTGSLLPALIGATLPLWLRPPGFAFRWLGAIEFLIAALLLHAGFSFLLVRFRARATDAWPASRLLWAAAGCIVAAGLVGVHLNSGIPAHRSVPDFIFIVFGLSALFAGALYVAPPFSLWRRAGGEIVIAYSLGFLPVLGAYLVQAGDLTRTVYVACLPLVVATGLWAWLDELVTRAEDEEVGRETLVVLFGARVSGRLVVPVLYLAVWLALGVAVLSASLSPWALLALLLLALTWKIPAAAWTGYENPARLREARQLGFLLHLALCLVFAASSVANIV
jgi:1,4-dihydroxy-2-naphthoate octaprenyltransferase